MPLEIYLSLDSCSSILSSLYLVELLYDFELWSSKSENILNSFGQADAGVRMGIGAQKGILRNVAA